MAISVVIPVYNSGKILPLLVERLEPVLKALGPTYELILVNDGSADGSWNAIEDLALQHTWICGINLMRNYGQHNAILAGIRRARHEIVVTMDDGDPSVIDNAAPVDEVVRVRTGERGSEAL